MKFFRGENPEKIRMIISKNIWTDIAIRQDKRYLKALWTEIAISSLPHSRSIYRMIGRFFARLKSFLDQNRDPIFFFFNEKNNLFIQICFFSVIQICFFSDRSFIKPQSLYRL
jgi:hypothetical protein